MLIKHAIQRTIVTVIWPTLIPLTVTHTAAVESVDLNVGQKKQPLIQFSVSDESEMSASRSCLLRTFQCKH